MTFMFFRHGQDYAPEDPLVVQFFAYTDNSQNFSQLMDQKRAELAERPS